MAASWSLRWARQHPRDLFDVWKLYAHADVAGESRVRSIHLVTFSNFGKMHSKNIANIELQDY